MSSSVRLSISNHLRAVGEEILRAVETRRKTPGSVQSGVEEVVDVRVFVLSRLSAVEDFMVELFLTHMDKLETLLRRQEKLLDVVLQPQLKLHRAGGLMLHLKWWIKYSEPINVKVGVPTASCIEINLSCTLFFE